MPCASCGSTNIVYEEAQGTSVCGSCGTVVEENTIVSEVSFGEKANGAATLQGTFVGAGQSRASFMGPFRRQNALESKEQSIRNGRDAIFRISTALRISERYAEAAQRFFNLALAQNFTRGRKTELVAASCLYVACRFEATSHMLIDFSEILQMNLFALGGTFLDLITVLRLKLPVVDPALYVNRFAALLDLGDKTELVARDANKLVSRMNIDWLRTGRRPAGICGACLLIAARIHGFRRTEKEVMRIVKIGEATLKLRLAEFMDLPSAQLTVENFRYVDLEGHADPPAFKAGLAKAATKERERQGELQLINSSLSEPDAGEVEVQGILTQIEAEDAAALKEGNGDARSHVPVGQKRPAPSKDSISLSDVDDDEINAIILSTDEHKIKERLWLSDNQEYLLQQALRTKSADDVQPKKRKKRATNKKELQPANDLTEAALHALGPAVKKLSRKVNYEALEQILEADNAAAGANAPMESLFEMNEEPSGFNERSVRELLGNRSTTQDEYGVLPDDDGYDGYDNYDEYD